jgi:hypothetical protein
VIPPAKEVFEDQPPNGFRVHVLSEFWRRIAECFNSMSERPAKPAAQWDIETLLWSRQHRLRNDPFDRAPEQPFALFSSNPPFPRDPQSEIHQVEVQ